MNVSLDIQTDDIALDINSAIPCGLIVNELVSNALKHAFPPDKTQAGHIHISIRSVDHDQLALSVSDDGAGLPPGLVLDQPPSLGLRLVTMLTQQLGGRIEMARDAGTAFKITFPHPGHNSSEEAGQ
jgi:two-component sensor histidine kinase